MLVVSVETASNYLLPHGLSTPGSRDGYGGSQIEIASGRSSRRWAIVRSAKTQRTILQGLSLQPNVKLQYLLLLVHCPGLTVPLFRNVTTTPCSCGLQVCKTLAGVALGVV